MSKRLRFTLVVVVVAFHLAADLWWPIWTQGRTSRRSWMFDAGHGFSIAQLNLIATWAALSPGRLVVRLPWTWLLGVLVWYALVLGRHPPLPAAHLGLSILFLVLAPQLPLWIVNIGFGWRLVAGENEPSTLNERQFRLSHLLAGTFLLCVALTLARLVLSSSDLETVRLGREFWILHAVVALCNLLVSSPCIWGAFASWRIIPLLAVMWVPYALLMSLMEVGVLTSLLGGSTAELAGTLVPLNLTQCITVWGTLLLLRAMGFRLVRDRGRKGAELFSRRQIEPGRTRG